MSYNGTGVYTLPGSQLVNGEVVSATENNQFRNDVASALNTAWTRDGQAPATSNIPMANHKFTGLLPGTENGDSVCFEQVTSNVNITGGTINGVVIGGDSPVDGTFEGLKEIQSSISANNIDLSVGNYFTKTITTTTTFTVSNTPETTKAVCIVLDLTNGGSQTISWWSGMTWTIGTAPTLTASGRDVLGFFTYDGGTTWSGFLIGRDVK